MTLALLQEAVGTGVRLRLMGRVSRYFFLSFFGGLLQDWAPLMMKYRTVLEVCPVTHHLLAKPLFHKCAQVGMSWCQMWTTLGQVGSPSSFAFPPCHLALLLDWNLPLCPSCRGICSTWWRQSFCERRCCFLSRDQGPWVAQLPAPSTSHSHRTPESAYFMWFLSTTERPVSLEGQSQGHLAQLGPTGKMSPLKQSFTLALIQDYGAWAYTQQT